MERMQERKVMETREVRRLKNKKMERDCTPSGYTSKASEGSKRVR